MRKIYILLVLPIISLGQNIAIDSKKSGVFVFNKINTANIDLTAKDFSVSYAKQISITEYNTLKSDAALNVTKSRSIVAKVGVTNVNTVTNVDDISKITPGYKFRIGYQTNVEILPDFDGNTFTTGVYGFYHIDRFKFYDSMTAESSDGRPSTIGAEGTFLWFPAAKSRFMVVNGNVSVSEGWNDNELVPYKNISGVMAMNDDIVAFSEFDGKYGMLRENLTKVRASISSLFYFGDTNCDGTYRKILKHVGFIPYGVMSTVDDTKPVFIVGGSIALFGEGFSFCNFSPSSAVSFSIDQATKNGEWGTTNFSLKGTFNIK